MLPYCVKQNVNQLENLSCSITGDMPKKTQPGSLLSAHLAVLKYFRILSALFTFSASSFCVFCNIVPCGPLKNSTESSSNCISSNYALHSPLGQTSFMLLLILL